jgi:guanylate kinase
MRDAQQEMSHYSEYDYVVINDNFDTALHDLSAIFTSERLRLNRQVQEHAVLFQSLAE